MRKLLILTCLLFTNITLANDCPSMDQSLRSYEMGLSDISSVLSSIGCNLETSSNTKAVCETKIGVKQDILNIKKKMFDVGLITSEELGQSQSELNNTIESCN